MLRAPGLALLATLALAAPAQAAPTWLNPVLPFGDAPARSGDAGMAMAPDGTIVVARFSPNSALEVRERPPGGPVGATVTLPHVLIDPEPEPHMQVLVGEYGTVAILYDAGTVRYATLRPPGGTWTRAQVLAPAGTDEAAVGPDGAVWAVGADPEVERGLAIFRLEAGGHAVRTPLPAPPAGVTDRQPALAVPYYGAAHVAYAERSVAGCTITDRLLEADVPAQGAAGTPDVLGTFTATGPAGDSCQVDHGELLGPPKLAADDDGDDTVAYPVRNVDRSAVTTRARHRARGDAWQADEHVSDGSVPDQLVGGRGAPVAVLRSGAGRLVATRGAGGAWTPPAPLSPVVASFAAARTGTGTTVFAWVTDTFAVARVLGADEAMTDAHPLGPVGADATLLGAGGDGGGDAAVLYSAPARDAYTLELAGYDAAGPRVTALSAPHSGFTSFGLPFAVEGLDVWSGPADAAMWDFGDGTTEPGVATGHAFARAGRYPVTVSVRDAVGNATTAERTIAIADPAILPAPAPPVTHTPILTGVRITGTGRRMTLRLRADQAGTLHATFSRGRARHRLKGRIKVGRNAYALPRLRAGTWHATVTEVNRNGRSSAFLRFRVRPRP